ncbi:glycine dehydrogenase [Psychroserpens algicola]|uniref:Glycine dehydrogenase n=1 Tax=Psychroserpens algicola TaxID=1719034 RepID=A0ABT0H6T8_9FLAO|nr:glycine dehydrogenase [Psychroserpens algicola]MCK8480075.1 glycine dehydrogenase [Psychroserpens algicola]
MSNKFFIPCKEANHVCDKTQYKEATLWEKIKLNIHLLYCKACRKYTKNNAKLTKLITKKPVVLDASAKEQLKAAFEKELAKQQH